MADTSPASLRFFQGRGGALEATWAQSRGPHAGTVIYPVVTGGWARSGEGHPVPSRSCPSGCEVHAEAPSGVLPFSPSGPRSSPSKQEPHRHENFKIWGN